MAAPRDIGVDVSAPEGDWDGSETCPFYGNLRVRGQIIEIKYSLSNMPYQNLILEFSISFWTNRINFASFKS